MKLSEIVDQMVVLNLPHRNDRLKQVRSQFSDLGLAVTRVAGVNASRVRDSRGFMTERRYACSLGKRLALRLGRQRADKAVLLFEDDVVLAKDLHEKLAEIELPDDWGIFFLGCKHLKRPEILTRGLVRVTQAADNHAMIVRREYVNDVIKALSGHGKGAAKTIEWSDVKLSLIQDRIPAYAAFPNLAWQALSHSDNINVVKTHYSATGQQTGPLEPVKGLLEEMQGLEPARKQRPPAASSDAIPVPGLDFLLGSPVRRSLEEAFPFRRYINLGIREDRRHAANWEFLLQRLEVRRTPAVNGQHARNIRSASGPGAYGCALSHRIALRQAALSGAAAALIFEDDLVLHPEFRELAERIPIPEDWGIFYFGCTHVWDPIPVAPGIVSTTRVYGTHAYAVRQPYIRMVMQEMRAVNPRVPGARDCDVALTNLSGFIPSYAAYPNLAWQAVSFSNIGSVYRKPFEDDGTQLGHTTALPRASKLLAKLNTAQAWSAYQEDGLKHWPKCPECGAVGEVSLPGGGCKICRSLRNYRGGPQPIPRGLQ